MIKIEAEKENYRDERLIRVLAKINKEDISKYLLSLDDHEGCLVANFKQIPLNSITIALINAWHEENEITVEILLNGVSKKTYRGDYYEFPQMD